MPIGIPESPVEGAGLLESLLLVGEDDREDEEEVGKDSEKVDSGGSTCAARDGGGGGGGADDVASAVPGTDSGENRAGPRTWDDPAWLVG